MSPLYFFLMSSLLISLMVGEADWQGVFFSLLLLLLLLS
jgi:hypothetical protein